MSKSETKTTLKENMSLAIKKATQSGLGIAGIGLAHVANRFVPASFKTGIKGMIASAAMFILGIGIAVFSKNEHVQQLSLGFSTYGGIKLVNNLIGTKIEGVGVVGGIDGMPEGMRSAIAGFFPTLNGDDDFVIIEGLGNPEEVETTYEFVGNLTENPSDTELYLPVSGFDENGNPITTEQAFAGINPSDMFA